MAEDNLPGATLDPADVARFSALAREWWDPHGPFAPLHRLNPARLAFIREEALAHFNRDGSRRRPFEGLSLLDVGCGGGLTAEPMARLGFAVTGLDASEEGVDIAVAHAREVGLAIDYRTGVAEDLAREDARFDVILALEVVEHVADPRVFVADLARMLNPGGLLIMATLNRTLASLVLGKIAAEYLLRWVPAGTHDWNKFVTPDELTVVCRGAGLMPGGLAGLSLDPVSGAWRRTAGASINYMMAFARPGSG